MKSVLCSVVLLAASVAAMATPPKVKSNLPRLTAVSPEVQKRDSAFQLYAYGGSTEADAIGGLPVIYASDGNAYLGKATPPGTSAYTNVSFTLTDTELVATNVNNTKMYIQPDSSDLNETGFVASPNSTQTTTGFIFFGASIFWKSDSDDYQTYFYAIETEADDVYQLKWGSEGQHESSATPVALRDIAPTSGKKVLQRGMFKTVY